MFRVSSRLLSSESSPEGGYSTGPLGLPFVGICSFLKSPLVHIDELARAEADVAILGAPYDCGTQYRAGARFGPKGIRDASAIWGYGHSELYDPDFDISYSFEGVVDIGDVDMIHTDTVTSHANITSSVKKILDAGVMPVTLGGDHSITAPILSAYEGHEPFRVLQIDAHLDYVDERHGVRFGHGNCMKRASEMSWVKQIFQLGIRGVSSTSKSGFDQSLADGNIILGVRDIRRLGVQKVVEMLPPDRYYITIDIDAFDPPLCPGTGTPSPGGLIYHEVQDLMWGLTGKSELVGVDLTEVTPCYDNAGITAQLAARTLIDIIGFNKYFSARR